ncbi:serine hydrolase domain-containing protein [Undibacterium sp. TJN25]|uniref:serine hydrolase domain-containing protein n=1 Tax=Undibacterium sp. TJN25 TaxID=3413056 RepID=UPI003BF2C48A
MSFDQKDVSFVHGHATRANWRTSPFSQWAFHNVRDIIPSVDIENDPIRVVPLLTEILSFDQFSLAAGDGQFWGLDEFLRKTCTDGFVVLHDNRVVYEFYDNGMTQWTPHILMSATKSVVGLIAGILQSRGVLDVDALVSDFVPEVARTAYSGATIRQLLDMRTSIVFNEQELRAYDAASNWNSPIADDAEASLHAFFEKTTGSAHSHGGPFRYLSPNTDLLGWVLERATGRQFAELASELLWKPMGAESSAYITVDDSNAARCTGGLCATARDFARIGWLVAADGYCGAAEVLPSAWIQDMADHGDCEAWNEGDFAPLFSGTNMRYRSGWYVIDDEPKTLFAMDIYGQNLFVDQKNRIVIAKMSSQAAAIDPSAIRLTHQAVAKIRHCLTG